jgi:hypothetical protein
MQEQDLRGLAGIVGGLPGPSALGVGSAEGRCHRAAKRMRTDCAAAFEISEQQFGGPEQSNAGIRWRKSGRDRWRNRNRGR